MLQLKPDSKLAEPYSFKDLCLPHYDEMVRFARRLTCGDHARADDIVQDSMTKAMLAGPRWRPQGDPLSFARAWLYRIVSNTCSKTRRTRRADEVRVEKRWRDLLEAVHPGAGPVNDIPSPHYLRLNTGARANAAEIAAEPSTESSPEDAVGDEVLAALGRLSVDHREVVMLRYVSGLECEEIAVALCVPKNTVFTRLARARGVLEKMLRGYAKRQYGIGACATLP